MNSLRGLVFAAAVAGGTYLGLSTVAPPCPDGKCPTPAPAVRPVLPAPLQPAPAPAPKPKRPRPWVYEAGPAVAGHRTFGEPDPAIDLLSMPSTSRKPNISSKGSGCCTFRSAEYAAHWQNVPQLYGLPEWMREQGIQGGGWPQKQADMVRKISEARRMPAPRFVQYEGNDPKIIELALKTGRVPCITWQANHMLVCVYLDKEKGAILDNNDPDRLHWYSRADFVRKWTAGGGGWVFLLLAPPPPPPPAGVPAPAPAPAPRRYQKDCPCSPACTCGCNEGLPCRCGSSPSPAAHQRVLGVQWAFGGEEHYYLCGQAVSRQVIEDELVDDTGKQHLTLIGTEPERKAVVTLLGASAERYHLQEYDAGAWPLSCGFQHGPGLTIYLQDKTGKVLFRRHTADGVLEALRRQDPARDPNADPTGDPPKLAPSLDALKQYWPWLAGGGALLALWMLRGGGQQQPTYAPTYAQPVPTQPAAPRQPTTDELLRAYILKELAAKQTTPKPPEGVTP